MVDWSCDYATFLERKQAVLDSEEKEWDKFDKKLAQEEIWIRKGVKARRTRNEGRVRALERLREERKKRRDRTGSVKLTVGEAERSGELVMEAVDVSFGYTDNIIIKNFTATISRGDRIGIIGPNGFGKTTLLNLLVGKLTPGLGKLRQGTNVQPVYFDQLREVINPDKSVWENLTKNGGDSVTVNGVQRHVFSYLQDFLFTSDRAKTPAGRLSGGERHRLMLAQLFTHQANLLIFDEPTNDLDTETLELLEEVLADYAGTILVVSHDREFLNHVATSTLVFEGNGLVKEYIGGYDDWIRQRKIPESVSKKSTVEKVQPESAPVNVVPKKLSYNEKRELEALPAKIEILEKERDLLYAQIIDPACFTKPGFVQQSQIRIEKIGGELSLAYERWEILEARS